MQRSRRELHELKMAGDRYFAAYQQRRLQQQQQQPRPIAPKPVVQKTTRRLDDGDRPDCPWCDAPSCNKCGLGRKVYKPNDFSTSSDRAKGGGK